MNPLDPAHNYPMRQLLDEAKARECRRVEFTTDLIEGPASWRVTLDARDLPGPCIGRGENGGAALRNAIIALDKWRAR